MVGLAASSGGAAQVAELKTRRYPPKKQRTDRELENRGLSHIFHIFLLLKNSMAC